VKRNNYARWHDATRCSNIVEVNGLWVVLLLVRSLDVALDLRLSALRHVVTVAGVAL
jgi:hypothetical protein